MATPPAVSKGEALKVGYRVQVAGKDSVGTVAFVGTTQFSSGKWIGVVLDDAVGKNNGTVQGKSYFTCPDNRGIFVRQGQLILLDSAGGLGIPLSASRDSLSGSTGRDGSPSTQNTPPSGSSKSASRESLSIERGKSMTSAEKGGGTSQKVKTPGSGSKGPTPGASKMKRPRSSFIPEGSPTAPAPGLEKKKEKDLANKQESMSDSTSEETTTVQAMTDAVSASLEVLQLRQENDGLKSDIKDLEEKLETLKLKRQDDKAKLKDSDKLKIQLEELQKYKVKMQESNADLQKQLQNTKREAKDVQDSFDAYKEEMAESAESMEIATLDKEMAEEKAETLQTELDLLKDRNEELSVELELMKAEIDSGGTLGGEGGGVTTYQMKQLEQQNDRLKEALMKFRDLSQHEKQENVRLVKDKDAANEQIKKLSREKESLSRHVADMETEMAEMKEQVDAALGAEEMVELLTERNLQLEEKVQEMQENLDDVEAMNEMNEELQEHARETEMELREELDMANAKVHESHRQLEATKYTIADYEATITKFRELVSQLQDQNRELRQDSQTAPSQTEGAATAGPPVIEFDFKTKFAETKAYSQTIQMELRALDLEQCNHQVRLLTSFMPDNFFRRGGDHDALQVLLLIPRMIKKAELLASQICNKFEIPEEIERADVYLSSKSEQASFACSLTYQLARLVSILSRYETSLATCSVELYLKVGTLFQELAIHEKCLDYLTELLRKDQLDETISLESLEKSLTFFHHLYNVHLASDQPANQPLHCTESLTNHIKLMNAAADCIHTDLGRLKFLAPPGGETPGDIASLFKDLDICNNDCKQFIKKIRRRIPPTSRQGMIGEKSSGAATLLFDATIQESFMSCADQVHKIVMALQDMSRAAQQEAAIHSSPDAGGEGLTKKQMEEVAFKSSDKTFGKEDQGPFESLKLAQGAVIVVMNKLATAMQEGEYDVPPAKESSPPTLSGPVNSRANQVKSEFQDAENLRIKLEHKEDDIRELKKALKLKAEELSAQHVRVSMLEKKLETASRENDDKVEKIQRKLDEAILQQQKDKKTNEETLDALQADIDALEKEKADLKERLRVMSKQKLLEGLSQRTGAQGPSAMAAATLGIPQSSLGSSGNTPPGSLSSHGGALREAASQMAEIQCLQDALKFSQNDNWRLKTERMKHQLEKRLPPLPVFKKIAEGNDQCENLMKQSDVLKKQLIDMSVPQVPDLTKRKPGTPMTVSSSPMQQYFERMDKLLHLHSETSQLQVDVTNLLATKHQGAQIQADFSSFPTAAFAKAVSAEGVTSKELLVARIQLPGATSDANVKKLLVTPAEFRKIHSVLAF